MGQRQRVSPPAGGSGHLIRDSALGLVPGVVDALIELNSAVWDAGVLSPAEIELARLENAQHSGCVICRAVRYDVAIADGLEEGKVAAIQGGEDPLPLSPREQLIQAFVRQFNLDPGHMPEALRDALAEEFTGDELAHLGLLVAYFSASSRGAVALGGMPAEMPRIEVPIPR